MKAAIFKGKGNISLENVDKPKLEEPKDAIVRVTMTTICGTDLHMYHGVMPFETNHILGHEFIGVVDEVASDVTTIMPGDKVLGTSSIACGYCRFCQMGEFSQCMNSNPNYPEKGGAFFGSPSDSGGYQGAQAEFIRVPYSETVLYKIPNEITDKQALMLSDIFPTGYHGAVIAEVKPGESVAVFGAGPVGQMAALSCKLLGASKIFVVDHIENRLQMAIDHTGATAIDYSKVDPVEEIMRITDKIGVDKCIDAVGLEAEASLGEKIESTLGMQKGAGRALRWAIDSVRRVGVVAVIGLYSGNINGFPIGRIMTNNITLRGGNCPHRRYLDTLINYIREGKADPSYVITQEMYFDNIRDAYDCFDNNSNECIKVAVSV